MGERVDALGGELRVVFDPAQQRRAAGVLPEQAEEVQAGDVGEAALVADPCLLVEDRELHEGVVEPEPGRPHHPVDREPRAVVERH